MKIINAIATAFVYSPIALFFLLLLGLAFRYFH